MSARDTPLRDASIFQLVEELARRQNSEQPDEPELWCDDCSNFRFATPYEVQRKGFNPCLKKHRMEFFMPTDEGGPHGPAGYYRNCCPDRTERREPPAKPEGC